ncbi:TonB-dependent receptor plug domain-containing protein [uncultured Sphingomonas sp.]|uniref:TonB-dependent receptor plug domain-containing protein n=1 Tax=uncultured Sphingomonas sp. TaxID=158754 RepID=UPI0035CBAE5E
MKLCSVSIIAIATAGATMTSPAFAQTVEPASALDKAGTTPQPGAAAPQTDPDDQGKEIIITGTRATGVTAAESATPIKVLSADALSRVGPPNLSQALTQLIPSFNAQAFGGDTGNLTLSARLRGVSPNHTLIMVNGKRRHGTANLQVLGGTSQGGAAPDLDLIIPLSIARVEVLEQGAAAQYGSDAIAGVINIILKDDNEGGELQATGGQYYRGDGTTVGVQGFLATKVGDNGFLNVSGFYRFHDFSQQGGLDLRVTDPNGVILSSLSPALQAIRQQTVGYPYINKIVGDAQSKLFALNYNAGYDYGSVQVYTFGTFARRTASAYENTRVPDRVIASPVLGVAGSITTPGELIFAPRGFNPREGLDEQDFAFTGGIKGEISGFKWDFSTTYGEDRDKIFTYDSANASLFVDTHFTPTNFYNGYFLNKEFTANLDLSREFDVGMAGPLNVAGGIEYRDQKYTIGSGDPGSIYKEGGQSYPGFRPSDAGTNGRHNTSLYVDVALNPIEGLKLDGAVRYENYSDFGDKVIWKTTARYDITPAFALRGTVSTGFRAPTLPEEFYSATNVSPTSAVVQLPPNSAAAALVGFKALRPETSTTYSAGVVIRPIDKLDITIDAYQIKIKDRIIGSGSIIGRSGGVIDPVTGAAVLAAIAARGNIIDPTVGNVSVAAFTNGIDTRTRGIDVTATYPLDVGFGRVLLSVSGNYNETKITKVTTTLVDTTAMSTLETGSPKAKVIFGATLVTGPFDLTLRETVFGSTSILYRYSGNYDYVRNDIGTAGITDLEASYKFSDALKLSIGANNLFDKKPPLSVRQLAARGATAGLASSLVPSTGTNVWDSPLTFSPYGINGGYYYARATFKF